MIAPPRPKPLIDYVFRSMEVINTVEADKNQFEVMTAVIFDPEQIDYRGGQLKQDGAVSTLRGKLTNKHCDASALADEQSYLK